MQENDMINDLIQESREHLQEIEPILLKLEKDNNLSTEEINQVFRAIHSIKGGFGFFGYQNITSLSHSMENILARIRDNNLIITEDLVDALFKGIDKLRIIFDDFGNSDSIPIESELKALSPFTNNSSTKSDSNKVRAADLKTEVLNYHKQLSIKAIDEAISNGKAMYQIFLHSQKDLTSHQITPSDLFDTWEKYGKIIDFTLDLNSIDGLQGSSAVDMLYSVIFASVLEPDLIIIGLGVNAEQVRIIDSQKLKAIVEGKEEKQETVTADSKTTPAKDQKNIDESLRVKVSVLNSLMNLAGELVLGRNQLIQQFSRKLLDAIDVEKTTDEFSRAIEQTCKSIKECHSRSPELLDQVISLEATRLSDIFSKVLSIQLKELSGVNSTLQSIDSVTSQLQENIMQTRLQPVSVVFSKFPRVIRDLSRKLGKQIELNIVGQDVELDKSIVELLSDPLTHLVRNSADHGIEMPEERIKAGKEATGSIFLSAFQEGGKVVVKIEDDGQGLDIERIKESAIAKGIITKQSSQTMSPKELQLLIMQPGFSTAREVTDISGRGVGMDVVKSNIERLGGTIEIDSEFGKGMTVSLTLPLTLAIIPSLIISTEGRTFALPQVGVEELVRIRSFEVTKKIEQIQGAEVTRLREKLLPLVRLSELLDLDPTFIHPVTKERMMNKRSRWSDRRGVPITDDNASETDDKPVGTERRAGGSDRRANVSNAVKIVVVKSGQNRYGLIVDAVYDSEEIVVKPLPEYFKTTQVYAGATILGDGKVAMILDPVGIATKSGLKFVDIEKEQLKEQDKRAQKAAAKTEEILLFDNGSNECFGINLQTIARIEKADQSEIQYVGSSEFINREGGSFPLVRIHNFLPVSPPKEMTHEFFLILPKQSDRKIGIIAQSVYDVIETTLTIDTKNIKGSGVMGSSVINDKLTIILDMPSFLNSVEQHLGN